MCSSDTKHASIDSSLHLRSIITFPFRNQVMNLAIVNGFAIRMTKPTVLFCFSLFYFCGGEYIFLYNQPNYLYLRFNSLYSTTHTSWLTPKPYKGDKVDSHLNSIHEDTVPIAACSLKFNYVVSRAVLKFYQRSQGMQVKNSCKALHNVNWGKKVKRKPIKMIKRLIYE